MKVRTKIYEINLMEMEEYFIDWFYNSNETPLPIKSINGIKISGSSTTSLHTKKFPNPNATNMLLDLYNTNNHVNTKLSTTIIEYHDKHGHPIVYLYPDGTTNISIKNLPKSMNHQMRRNLTYQITLRQNLIRNAKKR